MRTAAVYSSIAGFAIASPSADIVEKFKEFQIKWGRHYVGEEYVKRIQYFEESVKQVKHFQEHEVGTAVYSHLGPFADASPEEMSGRKGLIPEEILGEMPQAPFLKETLDSSLNWVAKGAVNPIKNQAQCGSCWAFSTACTLEGTGFVSTGKLVSVSEQNIVDCDTNGCNGCNGGLPSRALQWSAQNGGVASEQAYPYTARDGYCRNDAGTIIHNTGHQQVSQDENQIAQALARYGPLSIAVDATPFQHYQGGILRNGDCNGRIDHAINIVGYGTSGQQYWMVRNSWGTTWGEEGYIRMVRGVCECSLCKVVVVPTGVTVGGSPPGPSPPAPPPCRQCRWWTDCPWGQNCYATDPYATHGCCMAGSSPARAKDGNSTLVV